MRLVQVENEALQVDDFVAFLRACPQLRGVGLRDEHIVVVKDQDLAARRTGTDVQGPGPAVRHAGIGKRRVLVARPRGQELRDFTLTRLLDHDALAGGAALRRDRGKRREQLGHPLRAAVADDETYLDLGTAARRGRRKCNRPGVEAARQKARTERGKHLRRVKIRGPLPLTRDAASILGSPEALVAVADTRPRCAQPPFKPWHIEQGRTDDLLQVVPHGD